VAGGLLVFLGTCLLLAMVPGPGAAVILRQAVRDGRRAAMMTVLGNESGLLLWGVAAACGLSVLVTASWMVYDVMRLAGAVALIVLGVRSFTAARRDRVIQVAAAVGPARSSGWHCYRSGLIANLANPKAAVFALSFLPEFAPRDLPIKLSMMALAVLWTMVDGLWFTAVIWFIDRATAVFSRTAVRRLLTQVSGSVLIVLGLRLALESR
jgi:threonine/homoserine/homoserine lactone efflux protein